MAIGVDLFTDAQLFLIWFFLLIIAFLGITFNGIIIFLYATCRELRTPMNILFVNLTVSDFLVSLLGTFVSGIYSLTQTVMQQGMCEVYGFVTYLGGLLYNCSVVVPILSHSNMCLDVILYTK